MEEWTVRILNGITFGALLFILSSGFTLALGVLKVVNIAHGALYLLSAYIAWSTFAATESFSLALLAGSVSAAIVGVVMQQAFLRRLYLAPLPQILATMGATLIIAEFGVIVWGGYPRVMGQPAWLTGATQLGPIFFPTYRLFLVAVALLTGVFLWFFLMKTRMGALVRASVDDEEMVRGMGINVPRLYIFVFAFTTFFAGLAGAIGAPFLGAYQGAEFEVLLLAVVVVVVGGLGSLRGALAGSLLVGLLDSVGRSLFPDLAFFTLFAPMIVVLAIKPTGLFGRT